jgi:hypothetical protein
MEYLGIKIVLTGLISVASGAIMAAPFMDGTGIKDAPSLYYKALTVFLVFGGMAGVLAGFLAMIWL